MAVRSTFGKVLTSRARRIGWQVDPLNSGGWVITCPDQFRVQVHTTPSDINAESVIMRELNNHGFSAAEDEFNRLDEDKRQERLFAAREANQRRLDAAQKHADALAKAAKGTTRVPEEVLLSPYAVPKTFERVLVTPELAQKLLTLNTANRPIRPQEVDMWKEVIERGAWHYTHQGIAIDSNGVLQDGQHRLSAVVKAGVNDPSISVELQISVGMPPENFHAIDNGLRRTFGDVAAHLGHRSHGKVGSVARMLIIYNDYPNRNYSSKVNNAEVADFLSNIMPGGSGELVGEHVYNSVNEAQAHWAAYRVNHTAIATVLFKLWESFGKDDPKVEEFIEGLRSGANLDDDDPRLVLHRVVNSPTARSPRTATNHLALVVKAWNKFYLGKKVKLLAFRPKVEDMPKLIVPPRG